MEALLFSLKYSVAITFLLGFLFALALVPRLHRLWRYQRAITVSMPCADPEEARLWITRTLKDAGQAAPSTGTGAFVIEPAKWQKKLGATTVFVEFPQPQMAAITGQSGLLKSFAQGRGLPLEILPNAVSFQTFLGGQLKRFYFFLAFVFALFFLAFVFNAPKTSTVTVMERPSSPEVFSK